MTVKEATEERTLKSQERKAMDSYALKLEATIDLLIKDYREATENCCTVEDARE